MSGGMSSGLSGIQGLAGAGTGAQPLTSTTGSPTFESTAQQTISQLGLNLLGPTGTGAPTPGVQTYTGTTGVTTPEMESLNALNALPRYIGEPATGPNTQEQEAIRLIQTLTGGNIGESPVTMQGFEALKRQFNESILPQLQNQMAMAGLGTSGVYADELRRAQEGLMGQMTPLLVEEIRNRAGMVPQLASLGGTIAERPLRQAGVALSGIGQMAGIGQNWAEREMQNRQLQAQTGLQGAELLTRMGESLAARERIPMERFMGAVSTVIPALTQQAAVEDARRTALLNQLQGIGATERGVAQAMSDAELNEFLRQQGLAEYSIWGPFGQIMPSTIGRTTRESGGGFGFGK